MVTRFISAQKSTHTQVVAELSRGHKETHWMWFTFPQILGLSYSDTGKYYAIRNITELHKFCNSKFLSENLMECFTILLALNITDPFIIFGDIDAYKFQSCLTLFSFNKKFNPICTKLLAKYFNGVQDEKTLQLLTKTR